MIRSAVHLPIAFLALVAILFTGQAHSALFPILGGTMVYDDDRDITWLADANYAQTSGFDADGLMTWADANAWADSLVFGGFSNWRLPSAKKADGTGPDFSFGGGEMSHLFYDEFQGSFDFPASLASDPNNYLALFDNLQNNPVGQDGFYWYTETYDPIPIFAWCFSMHAGGTCANDKTKGFYAWAVLDGNASLVPIPATVWLFGSGLIGLFGFARKSKK
ncbi:MAG: hypothetical protein V3R51_03920 [Gammaproteobacteria bacterium]